MRALLSILSLCCLEYASAQGSEPAQSATVKLKNIFSASVGSSNGQGGANVQIPIYGANALRNGIESSEMEVTLLCTSDFHISIASSSTNFLYTGPSTNNPIMPVKDVLSIIITENKTNGTISNGFNQYKNISKTAKQIINSGQLGIRSFKFKYKAIPGFLYPAGNYSTDIIYTVVKK